MENKQIDNLSQKPQILPADIQKLETSGGKPLPQPLKHILESELKTDLSKVRVHTGENAVRLTNLMGAESFSVGNHIVIAPEKYHP